MLNDFVSFYETSKWQKQTPANFFSLLWRLKIKYHVDLSNTPSTVTACK